jgi:hypothetical protein
LLDCHCLLGRLSVLYRPTVYRRSIAEKTLWRDLDSF